MPFCYEGCCLYSAVVDVVFCWKINFSLAYLLNHYHYHFSAIVIFIATDVAMTIIFISSSFISPSLFSLLVVFLSFFFIQKIQCEWCGYPSCPFSVTWEILSVEMVDFSPLKKRHFTIEKKLRGYWICLCDEYYRNNDGIFLIFFRPRFTIVHLTGVIIKNSTLPEEKLGSTDRNQSYPPTGTHPSPRSVSVWRSTNSSSSLSSTSKLTLCTHWSLMGNTATPHWVVTSGKSW